MLLPSIQYLRALAAMMVLWGHAVYIIPDVVGIVGPPTFAVRGVDLFFIVSGFVMGITDRGERGPVVFLGLRIVRIAPLYWLATLLLVAGAAVSGSARYPAAAVAKSLFFIPYRAAQSPGSIWPILAQGWTLNYEMFFYGLCAISRLLRREWRIPALVATLIGLVLCGRLFDTSWSPLAQTYSSPLLLEFAFGSLLAMAWLRNWLPAWWGWFALLLTFGCYGITSSHWSVGVLGACAIVAGSLHRKMCFSNCRPLLLLGNASYSVYLTHQFVLGAVAWLWVREFPHVAWKGASLFLLLALTSSVAVGLLCYVLFERPLTRHLRAAVLRLAQNNCGYRSALQKVPNYVSAAWRARAR